MFNRSSCTSPLSSALAICVVLGSPAWAQTGGRSLELRPGGSFEAAVESLQPGDTLTVFPGTYTDSGRIGISVRGSAAAPVLIKGAEGQPKPVITRLTGTAVQNTINIEGASHLTLRGLEIAGNGGDGINMSGGPSFITLEDLDIHDVDVGINFRSSMNNITVRRAHIRRTGIGGGTGEGMYVGCNDATCIVRDSLIENNWIHDALPGTTQGDGIEVKVGSHSNVIRDNVIYNMPYPGIFVYGTGSNPVNVVEGNVIWNCLEGIYAVADAVVRNNIVIGSGTGLSLYSHVQVAQMKNVTAVSNTLYDNTDGLYVRWGGTVSNMVLANNAIYSPGKTAVNAGGSFGVGAAMRANYVQGGSSIAIDGARFYDGGTAASSFVDAANKDFWPRSGSILIARGNASDAPGNDFNGASRSAPVDIGAYESEGQAANPGWRIVEGFKAVGAGGAGGSDTSAPSVSISSPTPGGAAVSGTLTLTAAAADNVAVAGVRFRVDGVDVGSEDTSAPYSVSWDSSTVSNGTHSITAVARDTSGNTTVSAPVAVLVANAAPTPVPPPAPPAPPAPAPSDSAANGGGGGCTIGEVHGSDPLLPALLLGSIVVLARRRHAGHSTRVPPAGRIQKDVEVGVQAHRHRKPTAALEGGTEEQ